MGLFDNMLKDEESLFINDMALDYDYRPPKIKFREGQQDYMATSIKPLFKQNNGTNLFISGKPGIGKTLAVRDVFAALEKETDRIKTLYVNCWKKNTFYKIALEFCEQLGYKWVHNKKGDELFKEVCNIVNKDSVVICFDEVDKLDDQKILYDVLEDINRKSIILVTNEDDWLAHLDQRVKSRLLAETLEFEAYNYDETRGILEERRNFAFVNGIWNDEAFETIVDKTTEAGDIRTGLFLLREAGNIAEIRSSKEIVLEHAEKAIVKLDDFKKRSDKDIPDEDKEILELVKSNSGKSATEVYDEYKDKYSKSYRTFQRKIKDLEKSGLIKVEEGVNDKGNKASIIKKLTDY